MVYYMFIVYISVFVRVSNALALSNNSDNPSSTRSRFTYDKPVRSYFATCIPGLEDITAQELNQIGAYDVQTHRAGVSFSENPDVNNDDENQEVCDMEVGLRALMWCRVPHLIMERICGGDDNGNGIVIHDRDEMYSLLYDEVDVKNMVMVGEGDTGTNTDMLTLSCRCIIQNSKSLPSDLTHSHYTALTLKNAIVDKCRDLSDDGNRPNVNTEDADVPFVMMLRGIDNEVPTAELTLYRCLSGNRSMHRRGYRQNITMHKAAMKESMASALLLVAGWDKLVLASKNDGKPAVLADPMMGSGTFGIEAALIAADIAPGLLRIKASSTLPPVLRWSSYCNSIDANTYWKKLTKEAQSRRNVGLDWLNKSGTCRILGNEMNASAFSLAKQCFNRAGLYESRAIGLWNENCDKLQFDNEGIVPGRSIIVCNPPWGLRLTQDVSDSWESLKIFLDKECGGTEAWILSGNKNLTRILRKKKSRSFPLNTGKENLRWIQYHIFGEKK